MPARSRKFCTLAGFAMPEMMRPSPKMRPASALTRSAMLSASDQVRASTKTVAKPVAMKVAVATSERSDNRAIPQTPWPLGAAAAEACTTDESPGHGHEAQIAGDGLGAGRPSLPPDRRAEPRPVRAGRRKRRSRRISRRSAAHSGVAATPWRKTTIAPAFRQSGRYARRAGASGVSLNWPLAEADAGAQRQVRRAAEVALDGRERIKTA